MESDLGASHREPEPDSDPRPESVVIVATPDGTDGYILHPGDQFKWSQAFAAPQPADPEAREPDF